MPFIHLERDPRVQPDTPVEIDWSHPLSEKLISYPYFTGAGLPIDLVDGQVFDQVSGSSASWGIGVPSSPNTMTGVKPWPLINFNDDLQEHFTRQLPPSRQFKTFNALTVAAAGWYVQSGGNWSYGLFGVYSSSDYRAEIGHWDYGGAGRLGGYMCQYVDGSTDIRLGSGDNDWHIGVLSSKAGRQAVTVDGALIGTDINDYDDTSRTYSTVKIGVIRSAQAMNYGALWNRTLSDDEALWICAEPFDFILTPQDRIYFDLAAGGDTSAAASILAQASLTGTSSVGRQAVGAVSGSASTTPAAAIDRRALSSVAASASLTASAGIERRAAATLSGVANLIPVATVERSAIAVIAGSALTAGTAAADRAGAAAVQGQALLALVPSAERLAVVQISGAAIVTASGAVAGDDPSASITGSANLSAVATVDRVAAASVIAQAALASTGTVDRAGLASLVGTAVLDAAAGADREALASILGQALLSADAIVGDVTPVPGAPVKIFVVPGEDWIFEVAGENDVFDA